MYEAPVVEVWIADLGDVSTVDRHFGWRWLSDDERQRAERFRFDADRAAFTARRAVLRVVLGSYLDTTPGAVAIDYGDCGKPFVVRGPSFSASFSSGLAVVAVTEHLELGVDIERIRRLFDIDRLVALACTPDEEDWVRGGATAERYLRLWVRKEAVLKAVGVGLGVTLTDLHVGIPGAEAAVTFRGSPARRWSIADVELEHRMGVAAAIAVEGSVLPTLSLRDPAVLLAAV